MHFRFVSRQVNMTSSLYANPKEEIKVLKKQLQQAESQILQEKLLRNSLEEQFKKPLNVHQWRYMQSSEPEKYQLLEKINGLNKRLTKKNNEIALKDVQLKEHSELIATLEKKCQEKDSVLQSMEKQLKIYEKYAKQIADLKANLAELTAVRSQCKQYEEDLSTLNEELKALKMNIYFSKSTTTM